MSEEVEISPVNSSRYSLQLSCSAFWPNPTFKGSTGASWFSVSDFRTLRSPVPKSFFGHNFSCGCQVEPKIYQDVVHEILYDFHVGRFCKFRCLRVLKNYFKDLRTYIQFKYFKFSPFYLL